MYRTIVVGSSGEIGLAVMRAAIARGDQAFGLDLSPTDIPGSAGTGQIDLRNDSSVQAGFAAAVKQLGGVDVVVNAAGLMARGSLLETSVAEFLRTIDTNLGGAFRLTQAAARIMQPQGGGAIIHISLRCAAPPTGWPMPRPREGFRPLSTRLRASLGQPGSPSTRLPRAPPAGAWDRPRRTVPARSSGRRCSVPQMRRRWPARFCS